MYRRRRNNVWLLLLPMLALPCVSVTTWGRRNCRAVAGPFLSIWHWGGEQLERTMLAMPWNWNWQNERTELNSRIQELEVELAAVQELKSENDQLRKMLGLGAFVGWRAVNASVIGRDPMTWNERLLIDRGTDDGLAVGLAVLAGHEVVGRIESCGQQTSQVCLLGSPDCRISVCIGDTGVLGICSGNAETPIEKPELKVDYLPKNLAVSAGDVLTTSGIGNWMPAGLPVGHVLGNADGTVGCEVDHARLMLRGTPENEWGRLRFVAVLTPTVE